MANRPAVGIDSFRIESILVGSLLSAASLCFPVLKARNSAASVFHVQRSATSKEVVLLVYLRRCAMSCGVLEQFGQMFVLVMIAKPSNEVYFYSASNDVKSEPFLSQTFLIGRIIVHPLYNIKKK